MCPASRSVVARIASQTSHSIWAPGHDNALLRLLSSGDHRPRRHARPAIHGPGPTGDHGNVASRQFQGTTDAARRAPPYDNANFAFNNATSFYQILPNANLKPETSDGFEIGARGKYKEGSSWQLAAFYNLYFTVVVGMLGPITQFHYVNRSNVTIWGFEARGELRIRPE
jgi:outer membrane receptor protein involved in Fe transport